MLLLLVLQSTLSTALLLCLLMNLPWWHLLPSGERLQPLLDICSSYVSSGGTSSTPPNQVSWFLLNLLAPDLPSETLDLGSSSITEVDDYHHLGILRSLSNSSRPKIAERCSASRSAFLSLNAVDSRYGCLHPITSFRLYFSLSLPILDLNCGLCPNLIYC